MFCSNCGKQLEDNVAFCPECGTKVAVAAAPAVEPAAPVVEPATPVVEPAAPVVEPVAPVVEPAAPVVEPAAPVVEPAAPVVEKAAEAPVVTTPVAPTSQEPKKKNKGPVIAIIILAILVIALGIAIWLLYNDKKQDKDDEWESTEAVADKDDDEDEDEEPTPEPTEAPTPEPTEEPTPEPTEEPTPEPTEAPTPEPTEEPTPEPTEEPEVEPTDDPEVEPTDDPEVEPTDDPEVWDDIVFDVDTSAYEKCTVYETEMEVSGMIITDKQTVIADGDNVAILIESTSIDLSGIPEDEISLYADLYSETYDPIREEAPDSVEIVHGLDGNTYRFDMIIYLEDADLKELAEAGYISLTSGNIDTVQFISYEQTCAGLEAGGYTLVE